ncbi:hypothetical protein [Pseudomonas cannabina]|uniref:hypothetical protein n=1 Tax=Pseudomonas cannabina TaxID=86840 RepID=UPI000EFF830B|nr:hypothetical protein [Pseudomonas cannabina]
MTELTNPDVLAVNLPAAFLDKLTRYALEDAKLAAIDTMDREKWFAQKKIAQDWAEAATRLLLHCFNPPQGTALAEAQSAQSEAWLKSQGDAPPMVFSAEAWALAGKAQS